GGTGSAIGLFGGAHHLSLASGSDTIFGIGGTSTISGGSGTALVGLFGTGTSYVSGSGLSELFNEGGGGTVTIADHGGSVLIAGYQLGNLQLIIPHAINGNAFADARQIPVSHDAAGNTILDLGRAPSGEQLVLLVGVGQLDAGHVTLA